jgi:molybdopterin converting factor subunit 1
VKIEVLYFAAARELAGVASDTVELPAGARVRELCEHIGEAKPALAPHLARVRFAVNEEFAGTDAELHDGDVVAVIPPVAGGSPSRDRVGILTAPISVDAVIALVARPEAGAIALFLGTVRDHHAGRAVTALEYSAYDSMALSEMARIVEEIEAEIAGVRLAVHHRTGDLKIGELAVACAASSPHRDEAFRAVRLLIDRIKERVPIWKRELGPDGAAWVGWEDARTPPRP